VVAQRGLGDVKEGMSSQTDLAGVLAEYVDEPRAGGVAESLPRLGHPQRLLGLDVEVDDWLAHGAPFGRFVLGVNRDRPTSFGSAVTRRPSLVHAAARQRVNVSCVWAK
jgi:hypothetical protein